ncbi:MAG: CDP-glucose 4,6-dehydratase, partial [Nitriliruptoraceae bacterium]
MSDVWDARRVMVTGGTGMIGSWLVAELLSRGAAVTALVMDHDPRSLLVASGAIDDVHVINGRLERFDDVERAIVSGACDTVFHLGAQAIVGVATRAPRMTFEANIQGSWNVLDAARLHGDLVERVVVASSDKAYGTADVLPYTEDQPARGTHPYDVSKS